MQSNFMRVIAYYYSRIYTGTAGTSILPDSRLEEFLSYGVSSYVASRNLQTEYLFLCAIISGDMRHERKRCPCLRCQ